MLGGLCNQKKKISMIGGRGHGEKWMDLKHILEVKPTALAAELDVGAWGMGKRQITPGFLAQAKKLMQRHLEIHREKI